MRTTLAQGITFGALLVALAVAVYAWALRPDVSMKVIFAECQPYYASAHTAADTSRIDLFYPPSQTKPPNSFTCGALRKRLHAWPSRPTWGVVVLPFEATSPSDRAFADSARAHLVASLVSAGIRLVKRPPDTSEHPLVPARFAVTGALNGHGDSTRLHLTLVNIETTSPISIVELPARLANAGALGDSVGRLLAPVIDSAGR